jgi:hypothetical protein
MKNLTFYQLKRLIIQICLIFNLQSIIRQGMNNWLPGFNLSCKKGLNWDHDTNNSFLTIVLQALKALFYHKTHYANTV